MVQDYTSTQSQLAVHIAAAPSFEFLLNLFVYHEKDHDEAENTYEAGSTVIERMAEHGSPELLSALGELSGCGCGALWLGLIGHAFENAEARDVEGLVDTVRTLDPVVLRRYSLKGSGFKQENGYDQALIDSAAAGDQDSVAEMLSGKDDVGALRLLLEMEPEDTRARVVWILERFKDEVWPHLDDVSAVLKRDAAEKNTLSRTMSPQRLVDTATNGVTFDRQGWVSGIVLVPSAVIRPWVLITSHGSLEIFCYSVGEEQLSADPSAPPEYLVDMFKALADEKRLRILRVIDAGENQLSKIAERVDVAKSTAHHHLRVLRAAGLVRTVLTDGGSRYEIRREAIPETGLLLSAFLPGSEPQSSNA
jgi:DNA-binding transcriptional ArsR family regulator